MKNKVEMNSLVDEVVEAIEAGIRQGRYAPGDQLVERDLAGELGISRIPVREALRRLAAQHILKIRPYRGVVVRKLSRSEVTEVIDILHALGVLAVSGAAEHIDEKDHGKRLRAFMKKKVSNKKPERVIKEWIDINFPFYQLIAEISGNRLLPGLLKQFQLQMYRLVSDIQLNSAAQNSTLRDHIVLSDAILAGDVEGAVGAYRQHHAHTVRIVAAMPDSAFAPDEA